ncbi:polymeric immunoglobulin receptor-like isoform X2 [Channa argus]|uniref:polymeric immunoglobulin receptor-like isoform X2 n=1 Tax=Channa argus TaxID=215402 RepID=UPI002947E4AE|nr:hypothetical protein Q8A73_014503 [Channa argus]
MEILHTLICSFFLSLQDGNTVFAQFALYTGVEGGSVTVKCSFFSSGTRRVFCKEKCEDGNILVETSGVRGQSGRYSIECNGQDVFVTIAQLSQSDSGQYRCSLGTSVSLVSFIPLELIVVGALLDGDRHPSEDEALNTRPGGNITVGCYFTHTGKTKFFCRDQCKDEDVFIATYSDTDQKGRYSTRYLETSPTGAFLYVTITQLTDTDSGLYWCGLDRSLHKLEISVTEDIGDNTKSYLVLPLVVVTGLLSSATALMICRKRSSKPKYEATGLEIRGNSEEKNNEIPLYENDCPVSTCEDYLGLHPATRDQNQFYSTLTQHT